ncbi:hypothetical protein QP978_00170 [Corynebacterium sp. MSK035]|uniref:hypothetical protein n=1 Tax=Corynebacterium sp. MSK035 TaxID=3050192 RepID=UPI0025515408|nr:hypothetical protein [Corynebacterium sp. MSK035]MDK8809327.1 hypothetical protein [Corynebacterium sp. MSK035]
MNAHEPIDPWNSNQSDTSEKVSERASGTKSGKSKPLTLPLILGAVGVIVAGAAGFAMGGKNAESELASANEEIYSFQQQAEERESELQAKIDELEEANSELEDKNTNSDQASIASYYYKMALSWLNVCDAGDYMPEETHAVPTSVKDLGIGCGYNFEDSNGTILILVGGADEDAQSRASTINDQDGYLETIRTGHIQLNVWVSNSGPWDDAEQLSTDIADNVSHAAKQNMAQDTAGQ